MNVAVEESGRILEKLKEIKDGIFTELPDQKAEAIPLVLPPPISDQLVEIVVGPMLNVAC